METERWQQVDSLLQSALERLPEEREAFLRNACSGDLTLEQEVRSLLSAHQHAGNFLESPAIKAVAEKIDLNEDKEEAQESTRSLVGWVVSHYRIVRKIGSGGMGEVYRAHDSVLKRDVAIKILPTYVAQDADRLRRFEQEAQAAAALNHPHILAVHEFGTFEGVPYLVSELLEGQTLRQLMRRGPVPVRKAIDYGVQIAHGLAAAHEKGIVHRDLKPENLFVSKDGHVKILDFGLAKLAHREAEAHGAVRPLIHDTDPGLVVGTPGYMAPEQVRRRPADHRTDIFAFGATLYEMLSGKRAFQRGTSAETMTAILNDEPPSISQTVPSAPPGLQRVLHRCLEKNPEQRFQSASDLAFALEALSDPARFPEVTADRAAISHRRWLAAGSVALMVAAVLVYLWWRIPLAVPVVEGVSQITDDGYPKVDDAAVVSDGSRVYFNEIRDGTQVLAEVATTGGESGLVTNNVPGSYLSAYASDPSRLLLGGVHGHDSSLWILPLPAGEPRRLADLKIDEATLFPNGNIAFTLNGALYSALADGSDAHKLSRGCRSPIVSLDGKRIRSTVCHNAKIREIWEVNSDGSNPHLLLKDWEGRFDAEYGRWTADGRHFIFQSTRQGRADLWVLPESGKWFGDPSPMRLTNGPISYERPFPSADGRHIYVIGRKQRGEMTRYDRNSHQFVPFLSGISAGTASVSKDGKWVAYASYPDQSLWRSRIDGSDRLQLTYPPTSATFPHISPDGTMVVYGSPDANGKQAVYLISMDGGVPRKIVDNAPFSANWSPDGNYVVANVGGFSNPTIQVTDLRTGEEHTISDSVAKVGPWWPSLDMLVASDCSRDPGKCELQTFDFTTQKWSHLVDGPFEFWASSPDGQYFYFTTGNVDPKLKRVRFSDHKVEEITSLRNFRYARGGDLGVTPDGDPLLTRDIGTDEIYDISLRWH